VSDNRDTLIGFDSQVEFAKNVSATAWISEEDISEFDTAVKINNISWLFWIDGRWFFNNTKYSACSLLSFRNARHLTNAYTASDCTYEHDVTSGKYALRIKLESLNKHGCNVEDESDEDESDRLRVAEK
jgi:hypothetical protein